MTPLELRTQDEPVLIARGEECPGYPPDSAQGARLVREFLYALEAGWMAEEYNRAVAQWQEKAPGFWETYASL